MDLASDSVEAFLDFGCGDGGAVQPLSYLAGYRLIRSGEVVCSVKLPLSMAEAAVLSRSKIVICLSPSGQIEVSAGGVLLDEPIDSLIARTVTKENLSLEEAASSDLRSLLHRLELSVGLVREAIARMATAP